MSNFSALKTAIQNAIKQNGNEEITGNLLQNILLSIVETLGDSAINTLETDLSNEATTRGDADTQLNNLITGVKNNVDNGYVYAGIATPSTTPVSGKVFYIALQAGTYTNFGGTTVTEGITILKYNGTSWVKEQVLFTDGGVFDISAYHATGGTLAKYADLIAALGTSGANIPKAIRKGGMSVKYVQTDDKKYVQYRLMADDWSTIVSDWQGVDNEPTVGSDNLVKSGGVANLVGDVVNNVMMSFANINADTTYNGYIDINGNIVEDENAITKKFLIPNSCRFVAITGRQGNPNTTFALACAYNSNGDKLASYIMEPSKNYIDYVIPLPKETSYVNVCTSYAPTFNVVECKSVNGKIDGNLLFSKQYAIKIEANTDLNSITQFGLYYFANTDASTIANIPYVGGAFVIVEPMSPTNSDTVKQSLLYGNGNTYYRIRPNNVWLDWINTNENAKYDFVNAKLLEQNYNLNTLDYGLYSFTDSISHTLRHAPRLSGGGFIVVLKSSPAADSANKIRKQIAIYGVGETYYRYYTGSGPDEGFTYWKKEDEYDGVTVSVPQYWQSEVNLSIQNVLANRINIGRNIAEFIFITDTHDEDNAGVSPVLIARLQKDLNIPHVVHGGDILSIAKSTKVDALKVLRKGISRYNFKDLLFTLGNHDFNTSENATLTTENLYATVAKQVEYFGVTDKSVSVNYFDNITQKVRFVQYNYELTEAQRVIDTFKDLSSDWTVIIFTHEYWQPNYMAAPDVIAEKRTMMNNIIAGQYSCTIAAFIVGHVHGDWSDLLDNDIPVISTTTDNYSRNVHLGPSMTKGTDTEQAFDIVQIDTLSKILYFTRVGAGNDRQFSYCNK